MSANSPPPYLTYQCRNCGFSYDEEGGIPDDGIPPGTRWDKVPSQWICPDCGAPKRDFELLPG